MPARFPPLLSPFAECALLLLLIGSVYAGSLGFGFQTMWDDGDYVVNNPMIRTLSADSVRAMVTGSVSNHWAPLPLLTFAFEYQLWGLAPAGYHATNVVLHGLDAILVLFVVRTYTESRMTALLAALVFAVHPANTENVVWVSERKSLLVTGFVLLSLLAWHRYRTTQRVGAYWLALGGAAGAMVSKTTVISLPLILAASEALLFAPRVESPLRRWGRLLPFAVLGVVPVLVTLLSHVENRWLLAEDMDLTVLLTTIYPTAVTIWWKYVALLVWPSDLSALHDTELYQSWAAGPVLAALAGWIAVTLLVFRRGSNHMRFWYVWFWAFLFPVSNLIPMNSFYHDRYLYLPALGPLVLAGLLLEQVGGRPWVRPALLGGIASLGALLAVAAHGRATVWHDPIALWEDAATKSPQMFKARNNLAVTYFEAGRLDEAEREFRVAYRLWPTPQALGSLRQVEMARRRTRTPG